MISQATKCLDPDWLRLNLLWHKECRKQAVNLCQIVFSSVKVQTLSYELSSLLIVDVELVPNSKFLCNHGDLRQLTAEWVRN